MKDEERILVTRSSMPDLDEYVDEIKDLWDTHWLTNMGEKHRTFADMLKKYLDITNLELFVNGHMALEMVIQAMDLKGEVITTPFTFASTTHAIVRNGLTPVFCDIDPETYTMDPVKMEALITEKTSAVVPVHVYGNVCDTDAIECIAKKHGLKVIYDAAHAFGEKYNGIGVGNFGDASIFSFHATKVFNTIEGGAVCFRDEKMGGKLYDLKNFGIHGAESVTAVGANAKMNEFAAAMGICNLRHIDDEIKKRKTVFDHYVKRLGEVKGLKLVRNEEELKRNYSYFPVVFDVNCGYDRNEIFMRLDENGIHARKYFYPLTNEFDCYNGKFKGDTPVARRISESVLTLPIYADLDSETIDRICDIVLG